MFGNLAGVIVVHVLGTYKLISTWTLREGLLQTIEEMRLLQVLIYIMRGCKDVYKTCPEVNRGVSNVFGLV